MLADRAGGLDDTGLILYASSSGGVGVYLETLNVALAEQFSLDIVWLDPDGRGTPEIRRVGRSQLRTVDFSAATTVGHERLHSVQNPLDPGGFHELIDLVGTSLGSLIYWPPNLPWVRRLPWLGRRADHLLCRRDHFSRLAREVMGRNRRTLFVNHSPAMAESAVLADAAGRLGISRGIVYHGSPHRDRWLHSLLLRRLNDGLGTVTRRGIPSLFTGRHGVELGSGVDTDFFNPERVETERHTGLVVVMPARLNRNKGHVELLEAVRQLREDTTVPPFKLIFVGGEPDPEDYPEILRDFVLRAGLSEVVEFRRHLVRESLRELYATADIGVLPSRSEGRPLVLLEMQAMGLPLVVTDVGGCRDTVLPGVSARVVPPRDPAELAGALGSLLRDPGRRRAFGLAGRAFVREHFPLSNLVERHQDFLCRLAAKGARG